MPTLVANAWLGESAAAKPAIHGKQSRNGFSLIEVLVALAVLSIGLTGMAILNMNSLKNVHSSHSRSLGSAIALDFEERLWLELADNDLSGCPDISTGEDSPASRLIADWSRSQHDENWNWSSTPLVQITNLQIAMGTPVAGPLTMQLPFTLSWDEGRFTANETAGEQFDYTIQIVCRPVAT